MANIRNVKSVGDQLLLIFDDGTKLFAVPTVSGTWLVSGVSPTPSTSDIYNPWDGVTITGTWANHASYSAGGIDYPLPYGTNILAPSAGTLHTSGGSGEFAAGWVGSAGRRSVLYLDQTYPRIYPAESSPTEYPGPLMAIVVQHQSEFGSHLKHYAKGEVIGKSGASANGADYGGDVHLHVHGLQSDGHRVDFLKFIL